MPGGLPAGWRWEAFRDIEVAVPAAWAPRLMNPLNECRHGVGAGNQVVARPPAGEDAMACVGGPAHAADPDRLVSGGGRFLAFSAFVDGPGAVAGTIRDRTTVVTDRVLVTVQAEKALRERIVATLRHIQVDANGCPAADPVTIDPSDLPAPALDVRTLTGVRSVAACRYLLADAGPMLFSSLRLLDAAARRAVEAIAAAPPAGGQDIPQNCGDGYGDELIVLRVLSDQGESHLHLRYAGCGHNGIDDGVRAYRLTRAAVHPFVAGPNEVRGFDSGPGKLEILRPGGPCALGSTQWRCPRPAAAEVASGVATHLGSP